MKYKKVVVLDHVTSKVHFFKVSANIVVNDDYIANTLGFRLENTSYMDNIKECQHHSGMYL